MATAVFDAIKAAQKQQYERAHVVAPLERIAANPQMALPSPIWATSQVNGASPVSLPPANADLVYYKPMHDNYITYEGPNYSKTSTPYHDTVEKAVPVDYLKKLQHSGDMRGAGPIQWSPKYGNPVIGERMMPVLPNAPIRGTGPVLTPIGLDPKKSNNDMKLLYLAAAGALVYFLATRQ